MDREQLARVAAAASVFVLVLAAVCAAWFVVPSGHSGSVASAQDNMAGGAGPGNGSAPPPGASGLEPGGPPGPGPGPGAGPGAAPAPGAAAPAAASGAWSLSTSPLEPSRPNPFATMDITEEVKYVTARNRYGIDWSRQPLGTYTNLPQPIIPPAPPTALPPNPTPLADMVRVSAVMWPARDVGVGAPGRAVATYEDAEGRTRLAAPGGQIVVTNPATRESQRWRVVAVEPDAVVLRNADTGEESRMPVQPRSLAEQRYWGAKRMSDDLRQAQEAKRVVPGRGTVLPEGTARTSAATGQGDMGMGEPGGPPATP